MNLRHPDGRPAIIGHRGAAAVAPENTVESLAAAVAAGADLVEFDVGEGLVLGHPGVEMTGPRATLADALAYLATTTAGAHIDLKSDGIEPGVAAAVREHGLEGRAIVSSTNAAALRRLAYADPALARALGYPQDRHGVSRIHWPRVLVDASVRGVRPLLGVRLPPLLRAAEADMLSLHHVLVSRSLVRALHDMATQVIAWTVNDPAAVERVAELGVDGIVSDDPGMAGRVLATLNSA